MAPTNCTPSSSTKKRNNGIGFPTLLSILSFCIPFLSYVILMQFRTWIKYILKMSLEYNNYYKTVVPVSWMMDHESWTTTMWYWYQVRYLQTVQNNGLCTLHTIASSISCSLMYTVVSIHQFQSIISNIKSFMNND